MDSSAKEETSVKRPSAKTIRQGIGGKTSVVAKNNERNIKTTKSTEKKRKRQIIKTSTKKTKEKTWNMACRKKIFKRKNID